MTAAPRILLRSAFAPHTGYGNDGIGLTKALLQDGWDVCLDPEAVAPPLPNYTASLLTKPIEPPYDVVLHHSDPEHLGLGPAIKTVAPRVVAWTMWEYREFADAMNVGPKFDTYDAVIGYDEVSVEAITKATTVPVHKLQGGYWSQDWVQTAERDWDGVIRFGMVGMLNQRKNPFAAIRAFEKLRSQYGEKVELHLKTGMQSLHPAISERYPGVHIYAATWPVARVRDFYQSLHALVAPSWGEGKNLPALEAMSTGIPVIASAMGGHMEWADSSWGYLVDGTWESHAPQYPSFRVNEDALYAAMKAVVDFPHDAAMRGRLAARVIPAQCDWQKVVARLREVLRQVPARQVASAL